MDIQGVFGTQLQRLDATAGRWPGPTRGRLIRVIVPKQGRPLVLKSGFPADGLLDARYAALPGVDFNEPQSSESAAAADTVRAPRASLPGSHPC